jgi:hypothetical protein
VAQITIDNAAMTAYTAALATFIDGMVSESIRCVGNHVLGRCHW